MSRHCCSLVIWNPAVNDCVASSTYNSTFRRHTISRWSHFHDLTCVDACTPKCITDETATLIKDAPSNNISMPKTHSTQNAARGNLQYTTSYTLPCFWKYMTGTAEISQIFPNCIRCGKTGRTVPPAGQRTSRRLRDLRPAQSKAKPESTE